MAIPFLIPFEAIDDDRTWRDDVRFALDAAGLTDQQAADIMGLSFGQLSNQLALREHWSGWRERRLPWSYHIALAKRRMPRFGCHVVESGDMFELLQSVRSLIDLVRELKAMFWPIGRSLRNGTDG